MRKRANKIIFVLLLCICMCGITMTAFAATEYVDGYLRYTVADGSITITGYNGKESEVTVPSKIAGVPVNTIAAGAFSNSSIVTKINLPDTIMTIEEGAFGIGQTVVYNSNTNGAIVTEPTQSTNSTNSPVVELTPTPNPTEESTQDLTAEPTEEPTQDLTTEPTEEPTQESTTEPAEEPTQAPTQKLEEPTAQPSSGDSDVSLSVEAEGMNADKIGSVEEIDVDIEDVSEQTPSVNATDDLKSDDAEEQNIQNTENEKEIGEKDSEESDDKLLFVVLAVIVIAAAVVGICISGKKGRR